MNISVTSLDQKLQRVLEPRTSSPNARLDAVATLRAAGIPVGVMVAPIIPGLTDHEVPAILEACAKAGAQFAGYTIVRLPWAIAPLFEHWLEEHFPAKKEKVLDVPGICAATQAEQRPLGFAHQRRRNFFPNKFAPLFEVSCRRDGTEHSPETFGGLVRRSTMQLDLFG